MAMQAMQTTSSSATPSPVSPDVLLFQPFRLGPVTLRNRVVVSPMSTYSAVDGLASDFHLVHAGRFALGGAGLVIIEATAVSPVGRGTPGCLGLWSDNHVPGLQRIARFLEAHGAVPGIQLGHSGPKGAAQRPWHGMGPLSSTDIEQRGESPWPLVSSVAESIGEGFQTPEPMTRQQMDDLLNDFRAAARRACKAGFRVIELHYAHGYLLHSFLSPLVNHREDAYGGSLENRMRFPLEVVQAVHDVLEGSAALLVRISAVDGVGVGWSLEDSVVFSRELAARGVHAVACSSGGIRLSREHVLPSRSPGFQVPFAQKVRQDAGVPTIAVGLLTQPDQAEAVLQSGSADLVALGREMLADPNWAVHAALALQGDPGWGLWPEQFGWWLERRDRLYGARGNRTLGSSEKS